MARKKTKFGSRRKPILQLDDKAKGSQSASVDPYRQTSVQSATSSPAPPTQKPEQTVTDVGDDASSDAHVENESTSPTKGNAIDTKLQDFLQEINDLGTDGPSANDDGEEVACSDDVHVQGEETSEENQKKTDVLKVGAYSSDPESMEDGGGAKDSETTAKGEGITFWRQVVDPNTNHAYYWNPQTNEVCWTLPDNAVISADQDNTGGSQPEGEGQYADYYAYYSQTSYGDTEKNPKNSSKSERKSKRSATKKSNSEKPAPEEETPEAVVQPDEEGFVGPTLSPASLPLNPESQSLDEQAGDTVHNGSGDNEPKGKLGVKRKAPPVEEIEISAEVSPDIGPNLRSVAKKPRLKTKVAGNVDGKRSPKKTQVTSPLSKQAEQALRFQVSNMADELSRKLLYLHVTNEGLSDLQVLNIQLQTRLSDWKEGGLNSKYMLSKLQENAVSLVTYEQSAAPEGWKIIWDSSSCRYQYHNLSTGETTWQYPVQYAAETQFSELSSQEDNSDHETAGDDETSEAPLASTEDNSPKPHPHTGPLPTSMSNPETSTSPNNPPVPERVEEEMDTVSIQEADDTLVGENSVKQSTEPKAPLYHGPTAEYFMNQEGPPTYWRNKSRSTDVPPPPPPSTMNISVDVVREKLTPGRRQILYLPLEESTLNPEQTDSEDQVTKEDVVSDDSSSSSEDQEGMQFISEFPPRPRKKTSKKMKNLKLKTEIDVPSGSTKEEIKEETVVNDEARLRERLLERQKYRIESEGKDESQEDTSTNSASLPGMEAIVVNAESSVPDNDRVEQSTGEHERGLSDKMVPSTADTQLSSTEHASRGNLDDSRVEPETGEVETVASSIPSELDSSADHLNSIPYGPSIVQNDEVTESEEVKSKKDNATGDESPEGVEEGEIVAGSPRSTTSEDHKEEMKVVPLGRCYMDMEDERVERKKSTDKDDRYPDNDDGSHYSNRYSSRHHSSSTKPSRDRSPSPSSSKDGSYNKSSSRKADRRRRSHHRDDYSDSDRDRDGYRSSKRRHGDRDKDYNRSSDESDDYRYSKKDSRRSHRSSHGSGHYYSDDRDRSYSDDDRYERDRERSSRKSHREGSSHSSHHSRKHRSRSHSRDSRTSSRRHDRSRSHSRDSQSSYQSDHRADKDKKSPSSKRKKEKKDKKKRRKAEKEKTTKEDSSDSKPPPHVIVGKVGRISSKRTLGKDKKALEGDAANVVPVSGSETVELGSDVTASSTPSAQSTVTVATNPSVYSTQLSSNSAPVFTTTPQYMSASFYQQPSTGQVPYYPMGSYGDYQTGSVYDPSLYHQTVQEQGAVQSGGMDQGQQYWTGETEYGTLESAQGQEITMEQSVVKSQCEEGGDNVPAVMDVEKNETEDQIAECEMEIEDNSPDVIEQPTQQNNEETDSTANVDNQSHPRLEPPAESIPTSGTSIEPATIEVQTSKNQDDNKEPVPPGDELETTPPTLNNTVDTAALLESVETVESSVCERESEAPVELQGDPTHPEEENPPLPPPVSKPDDLPLPPGTSDEEVVPPPPGTETSPNEGESLSSLPPGTSDEEVIPPPPGTETLPNEGESLSSLPPGTSDEEVIPPPPGTETLPNEGESLSLQETATPAEADTHQMPPESEPETSLQKTDSEAPKSVATLSTSSNVVQEESNTVTVSTASSSYSYTPVSQSAAAYYQAGSGGSSTVPSGAYDYAAYAQSLAAQQQQAYNYAYATNNYSGYMQAYNTYLQQASAAASYGAYGGQYYPGTYAYPGGTSYANQYSSGAAYYGTGTAGTGSYNTASYQSTSQQAQTTPQRVQVQTTPQQQVQVPTTVESASGNESTDSSAQAKKSEFALAGSKQKQMKTMIDKWSTFKDSPQS